MLIHDQRLIGNNLLMFRKRHGLTQAELAEKAGVADRTYADIERGTVDMRLTTLLKICEALHVLPNDLLFLEEGHEEVKQAEMLERLNQAPSSNRETAFKLMKVYLDSINIDNT